MIKNQYIKVVLTDETRNEKLMTFEDYNRIVGDEFVTGKLEGSYTKPISPEMEIDILSIFIRLKISQTNRYLFFFNIDAEKYFSIKAIFVYPLNLKLNR